MFVQMPADLGHLAKTFSDYILDRNRSSRNKPDRAALALGGSPNG